MCNWCVRGLRTRRHLEVGRIYRRGRCIIICGRVIRESGQRIVDHFAGLSCGLTELTKRFGEGLLELSLKAVRHAAYIAVKFPGLSQYFGQLFRAENHEGKDEDNDDLATADIKHRP